MATAYTLGLLWEVLYFAPERPPRRRNLLAVAQELRISSL